VAGYRDILSTQETAPAAYALPTYEQGVPRKKRKPDPAAQVAEPPSEEYEEKVRETTGIDKPEETNALGRAARGFATGAIMGAVGTPAGSAGAAITDAVIAARKRKAKKQAEEDAKNMAKRGYQDIINSSNEE